MSNGARSTAGQPASNLDIAAALDPLRAALRDVSTIEERGRVTEILGTLVKAVGVRASIGELCELRVRQNHALYAEVVGFRSGAAILTPFGDITGLSIDAEVIATRRRFAVPTGGALLGRVLDGFGNPLDGRGPVVGAKPEPVDADPPPALSRKPVSRVCETGVRAIDALLTIEKASASAWLHRWVLARRR